MRRRRRRLVERSRETSAEDATDERECVLADRDAAAAGAAEGTTLIDIEGDEIDIAAARDAVIELGTETFEVEHLPEERRHHDD